MLFKCVVQHKSFVKWSQGFKASVCIPRIPVDVCSHSNHMNLENRGPYGPRHFWTHFGVVLQYLKQLLRN